MTDKLTDKPSNNTPFIPTITTTPVKNTVVPVIVKETFVSIKELDVNEPLRARMAVIAKEFNGESNIPLKNEYWLLRDQITNNIARAQE